MLEFTIYIFFILIIILLGIEYILKIEYQDTNEKTKIYNKIIKEIKNSRENLKFDLEKYIKNST